MKMMTSAMTKVLLLFEATQRVELDEGVPPFDSIHFHFRSTL